MKWTILGPGKRPGHLLARCVCGREREIQESGYRKGRSTQCHSCATVEKKTTHGKSHTAEYRIWTGIVKRVRIDPYYAALGLSPLWRGGDGFLRFLADIGPRPTANHSVDRIDNAKGYHPGNVRWATAREQQQNRRDTVRITIGGESLCVPEWSRRSGVPVMTIRNRIARGVAPADAIKSA